MKVREDRKMAYARIDDDSDVNVFSTGNELICAECMRVKSDSYHTSSREKMILHLQEHTNKGDLVPPMVFQRLTREIMMEVIEFYIWSIEHQSWWLQNQHGYTKDIVQAGRFKAFDAITICRSANIVKTEELMVPA